ncbi:DegT/DnrJ/EryC1/StrS family aminotransferase [Streptomyces phaeochromogenes]|uniref:DegT/DnrJ/EryC1/StrS family aminotransferase n=1 Tax=Streptomyces phaeochromogenes TaxID=1923 RepID=UPI002E2B1213|nr:DegT/DnrJ/EryC1/StrS family aminotransferase [Streptomyces phaeochromogenes]
MPGPGYAFLGQEERQNVEEVLKNWDLTRFAYDAPEKTTFVRGLELSAQQVFNSPYAIAVNSGTSALLTALAALDIGPGDEVIVPGYTFIASLGSIVYSGATPVLAEVDTSLTLDPQDVENRITARTRAIMAVHMLGAPCDMDALTAIANRHGLAIIEDTAQACGATYRGQRLGAIADIGAFSLNPFKVITSGEGGLVLTSDERLYKRAYAFQDQGWSPLRADRDQSDGDILFGLNLRMAELAAAVGIAQLDKLDTVLGQVRSAKQHLASLIPTMPGLSRRTLHDAQGECGTLLIYVLDDPAAATELAAALDSKTMINSGRHYYANMPQLAGLADATATPFRRATNNSTPDYRKGSLPQTDDVLARSIALSVGVSDSYLGAGFGITARSTTDQIAQTAEEFTQAATKILG